MLWDLYRSAMAWFAHLHRQEWLVLLLIVTVLGVLCMRGYGSRTNY